MKTVLSDVFLLSFCLLSCSLCCALGALDASITPRAVSPCSSLVPPFQAAVATPELSCSLHLFQWLSWVTGTLGQHQPEWNIWIVTYRRSGWPNDLNGPNENKHLRWWGIEMVECWIQILVPLPYREKYMMIWIWIILFLWDSEV